MTEALKQSMHDIYHAATAGAGVPEVVIVGGAVVNRAKGTNEYDVNKMYLVTKDGIRECDE